MLHVAFDNGCAVAKSAGEIARGSTIQALHQVLVPGVNLSVWERQPDEALVEDLSRLPNGWRAIRWIVQPFAVVSPMGSCCRQTIRSEWRLIG